MKKYLVIASVVVVCGALGIFALIRYVPTWVGTERNQHSFIDQLEKEGAPDFSSETLQHFKFNLNSMKGQVVILNFWASWCGPCVEEFPSMLKLVEKYQGKIKLVAVSGDSSEDDIQSFLKAFPQSQNENVTIIWDKNSKIARSYEVYKLPETFILGKDLKLSRKVVGSINWLEAGATSYFDSLVKGTK